MLEPASSRYSQRTGKLTGNFSKIGDHGRVGFDRFARFRIFFVILIVILNRELISERVQKIGIKSNFLDNFLPVGALFL